MLARITGTLIEVSGPPHNTALVAPDSQPDLAYEVLLPAYLADRLSNTSGTGSKGLGGLGEGITLHTLQYLESQNQGASFIPRLLGFASPREREFFELLTSVKGLGNKRAMRAMALEPAAIARAIADRNARFLQTLPEIGPKLAELIVHELKGKVDRFTLGTADLTTLDAAANSPARNGQSKSAAPASVEPKPARSRKPAAASPGHAVTESPGHPQPPIRQTVDALIALGENPLDAERMVARALDKARAVGGPLPTTANELLTAAYASR
jgi:Holliday junction DNA helicase RuvA